MGVHVCQAHALKHACSHTLLSTYQGSHTASHPLCMLTHIFVDSGTPFSFSTDSLAGFLSWCFHLGSNTHVPPLAAHPRRDLVYTPLALLGVEGKDIPVEAPPSNSDAHLPLWSEGHLSAMGDPLALALSREENQVSTASGVMFRVSVAFPLQ